MPGRRARGTCCYNKELCVSTHLCTMCTRRFIVSECHLRRVASLPCHATSDTTHQSRTDGAWNSDHVRPAKFTKLCQCTKKVSVYVHAYQQHLAPRLQLTPAPRRETRQASHRPENAVTRNAEKINAQRLIDTKKEFTFIFNQHNKKIRARCPHLSSTEYITYRQR